MCGLWLLAETRIKRYTENSQQTGVLTKPNVRKKGKKKGIGTRGHKQKGRETTKCARQPSICRAGLLCCAHKRKMMKQDQTATSSNKFTVYSKVIITLTSRTSEDVADFMSWSNSVVPTVRNTLLLSIST